MSEENNMKNFTMKILVLVSLVCSQMIHAGDYPASAESFSLHHGSRSRAMAEAFTAVSGEGEALRYNPAGLVAIDSARISVDGYLGLADSSAVSLLFSMPFPFAVISAELGRMGLPSDKQIGFTGEDLGQIRNSDLQFRIGAGRSLTADLSVGLTVKGLSHQFLSETSFLLGADMGGQYRWEKFTFGLAYRDLLLADNINVGTVYRLENPDLLLSADFSYHIYGRFMAKMGVEYTLLEMVQLRAGYRYGVGIGAFSFGAGFVPAFVKGLDLRIDYAFNPNLITELGQMHSISLEFRFGKQRQKL